MNYEFIIGFGRQAIETMLLVSLPVLGLSMFVGLIISVFQSVTQIQEMTITFVPKIVITFLALTDLRFLDAWEAGRIFARSDPEHSEPYGMTPDVVF